MIDHIETRILHIGMSPFTNIEYTKENLEQIVEKWKASEKALFGTTQNSFEHGLDLSEISTKIVDMYVDDEGLVVVQEILATPMGNVVKELINLDPPVSFSIKPVIRKVNNALDIDMISYGGGTLSGVGTLTVDK